MRCTRCQRFGVVVGLGLRPELTLHLCDFTLASREPWSALLPYKAKEPNNREPIAGLYLALIRDHIILSLMASNAGDAANVAGCSLVVAARKKFVQCTQTARVSPKASVEYWSGWEFGGSRLGL